MSFLEASWNEDRKAHKQKASVNTLPRPVRPSRGGSCSRWTDEVHGTEYFSWAAYGISVEHVAMKLSLDNRERLPVSEGSRVSRV